MAPNLSNLPNLLGESWDTSSAVWTYGAAEAVVEGSAFPVGLREATGKVRRICQQSQPPNPRRNPNQDPNAGQTRPYAHCSANLAGHRDGWLGTWERSAAQALREGGEFSEWSQEQGNLPSYQALLDLLWAW